MNHTFYLRAFLHDYDRAVIHSATKRTCLLYFLFKLLHFRQNLFKNINTITINLTTHVGKSIRADLVNEPFITIKLAGEIF